MKIIIDTDLGTDIDDVYALAFALRHPEVDVKAVTTVTGHPISRARLAKHLFDIAGHQDVPVAAGYALPMYSLDANGRKEYLQREPNHTQVADHIAADFPKGAAVQLLLETVDRHAGDIGIVAIGPLTNVAAAIMADPELPDKVKFIAIMGAELNYNHREYNVLMDPEASDIVYSCGAENMFLATWEVSRQVVLFPEHLDVLREKGDALCQEVIRCTDLWWPHRRQKPGPVLYDISPILWALNPSWFEVETTSIRVETNNPVLRAVTYKDPLGTSKLQVTTRFNNPEAAQELMVDLLLGKGIQ